MPGQGRLGDRAQAPVDAHGCPACPHPTIGPAIEGSPDVSCNGRPALRVGDPGIHMACCGPNTWNAKLGSTTVFINGKSAYRRTDTSQHCGGIGQLIEGSPNVVVGGPMGMAAGSGSGSGSDGIASGGRPESGQGRPQGGGPESGQGGPQGGGPESGQGTLLAMVTDERDSPVPGAALRLQGPTAASATTGPSGSARLEQLTPGAYQLTVTKADFIDHAQALEVSAGDRAVAVSLLAPIDWGLFAFDLQLDGASSVAAEEGRSDAYIM